MDVELQEFSCHLEIIAFAIGKIVLASLVQLLYLLLMQLFPNRTQIHVITRTNHEHWQGNQSAHKCLCHDISKVYHIVSRIFMS